MIHQGRGSFIGGSSGRHDGQRTPLFRGRRCPHHCIKFEADDDAFIIGGPATNFWAWFFQDAAPDELKLKGPFTSEDIDYFGSQDVARNVAAALGGQVYFPAKDDHTASTAQIVTTINGKPLKIDFLNAVLGIHDRELRRGVSLLEVEGELDGKSTSVLIKVLHPVQCLKSPNWPSSRNRVVACDDPRVQAVCMIGW